MLRKLQTSCISYCDGKKVTDNAKQILICHEHTCSLMKLVYVNCFHSRARPSEGTPSSEGLWTCPPEDLCRKENCFQACENEGRFEPNDYVGIPHMIWDSYATTDESVYSCLIQLTIASCILKRWIELAFSNYRFISTSTRYLFPSLDLHVGNSTQTRKRGIQ